MLVTTLETLPDDTAALQAALLAERQEHLEEAARAARLEAELAVAKAKASDHEALIATIPSAGAGHTQRPRSSRLA